MRGLGGGFLLEGIFEWLFGVVEPDTGRRLPRKGLVPDVRGFPLDQARSRLGSEGFKAEIVTLEPRPAPVMGTVVDQSPAAGSTWVRAKRVTLAVWHPPKPAREEVGDPEEGRVLRYPGNTTRGPA